MKIVLLLFLIIFGGLVLAWLAVVLVFATIGGLASAARDSVNSEEQQDTPNAPTRAAMPTVRWRKPAWIAATVRLWSPDLTRR